MTRALVLVVLAACGDGPGEQRVRGEATLETFVQRMCACRNAACSQLVVREMAQWTKHIAATAPKPDPAVTGELMRQYNACMARAAERP